MVNVELQVHLFQNCVCFPLCSMQCSNWLLRTVALEDSQNLVAGNDLDLSDTVGVAEGYTDLRRSCTFTSKLADLVNDLLGGGLQPSWWSARVWDGGGAFENCQHVVTQRLPY
jgi:hypothetical protein